MNKEVMNNGYLQDRLSDLINYENKNLDELAKEIGISKTSLSYYQNGIRMPKREGLEKIAKYFNTTTDYLLGRDIAKTKIDQGVLDELGLSQKAINNLRKIVKYNKTNLPFEFNLKMINSLIENLFDTDLLKDLYMYVYGDFGFLENIDSKDAYNCIFVKAICKQESEIFTLKSSDLQEIYFGKIQKDIVKYRDSIEYKASLNPKTRKRGPRKDKDKNNG
ncbi:MAG: helix-turn-helix transcriptional regulator [Cyanobacteria bacterium SIG28]|nr:helix-turn-helix transcriptional regulator [Cyanobacteria bacterium SIG28]